MKRIATMVLLVLSILSFPVSGFAQERAEQQVPTPSWKELGKGVRVLRLWGTTLGPKQPEIAILQLSSEEYQEFDRASKQYLDNHKIFGKELLRAVSRVDLSGDETYNKKAEAKKGDDWIAVVVHTRYSTYATVSVQRP